MHEMLTLIHNLQNVWHAKLRKVVMQNWLVNPTGKPNSFVEVDLVQEHLNFWIKKIYKADGNAHSWEWLGIVSPCIDVLRRLAKGINDDLGTHQGAKHKIPDLDRDIEALIMSLDDNEVYTIKPGRILDFDEKPVCDTYSVGMDTLTTVAALQAHFENTESTSIQTEPELTPLTPHAIPPPKNHPIDHEEEDVIEVEGEGGEGDEVDKGHEIRITKPVAGNNDTLPRVHDEDVALDMNDDLDWEEDDEGEEEDDVSSEGSDDDRDD